MAQGRAMSLEQVLPAHQEGELDCSTSHMVNSSAQQGNSPYSRYKRSNCSYKNPLSGSRLVLVAPLHKNRAATDRRLPPPQKNTSRADQPAPAGAPPPTTPTPP